LKGLSLGDRSGNGLEALLAGRKLSSRTSTKFEGNSPIIRLSRRSLPIHHDPSPALRHSIRSPSTNPRSRLDYIFISIRGPCKFMVSVPLHPSYIPLDTSMEIALVNLAVLAYLKGYRDALNSRLRVFDSWKTSTRRVSLIVVYRYADLL
jgi:hypothetical protein